MAEEKKSIGAMLAELRWSKATPEDRERQAELMRKANKIRSERSKAKKDNVASKSDAVNDTIGEAIKL